MGRKPRFDKKQFIKAALDLVARHGPGAVTIASIAREIGAPVGSVYHRFPSREAIIAEMWLEIAESFQMGFLGILEGGDAVKSSLYTARWARAHPRESRVLLLYRREELVSGDWPGTVVERAASLEKKLNDGIQAFVKGKFGKISRDNLMRTVFALIDVPLTAVRRYLERGEALPASIDGLVGKACKTIMEKAV
jgi:AcrR family transcriptional regulator